jgi:hypothetical protein
MGRIYEKNLGEKQWVKKVQIHHHLQEAEEVAQEQMLILLHQELNRHHHLTHHLKEEDKILAIFSINFSLDIENYPLLTCKLLNPAHYFVGLSL